MYFNPTRLILNTKEKKEDVFQWLKGITEEDADKIDVVPVLIYKFSGIVEDYKFNVRLLWHWRTIINLKGDITNINKVCYITINIKEDMKSFYLNIIFFSIVPIVFLYHGYNYNLLIFFIVLPATIATILCCIYFKRITIRHVEKLFDKIISGEFKNKLKFEHEN